MFINFHYLFEKTTNILSLKLPVTLSTLLLLGLLLHQSAMAQDYAGFPLLENFDPEAYQAHRINFMIAQSPDQLIYAANGKGVLQFDGESWHLIKMPERNHARSLAVDAKGRVYVGTANDIGVLEKDSLGHLQFVSWRDRIPGVEDFAHVYTTLATPDAIYWQSYRQLFRWKDGQMKRWTFDPVVGRLFYCNDILYTSVRRSGLAFLTPDDEFKPIPGNEFLEGVTIDFVIPSGDRLLIGSRKHGLLFYKDGQFESFETDIWPLGTERSFTDAIYLPNNHLAVVLFNQPGIFIIDENGRLLKIIDRESGMQNDDVKDLLLDAQKGLWVANESGLSRVDIMAPFSIFDDRNGILGGVQDLEHWDDKWLIATVEGLYEMPSTPSAGQIEAKLIFKEKIWKITSWQDQLLFATSGGAFIGSTTQRNRIGTHYFTPALQGSNFNDRLIYATNGNSLLGFRQNESGAWEELGRVERLRGSIREIIEIAPGEIWLKSNSRGLYKIDLAVDRDGVPDFSKVQVKNYFSESGIPKGNHMPHFIDQKLLLRTEDDELLKFDADTDRFVPYPEFTAEMGLQGGIALPKLNQFQPGRLWLDYFGPDGYRLVEVREQLDGQRRLEHFPVSQVTQRFQDLFSNEMFYADENYVWYGATKGLIRYALGEIPKPANDFPVYINQVFIQDSLVYRQFQEPHPVMDLPFRHNDLTFTFTAPLFRDLADRRYQFRLDGYDDKWSGWSTESKKNYTNLQEGDYSFYVRARDSYGNINEAVPVQFTIAPPWYRTLWAYLGYAVLAVVAISAIYRFRSRRLRLQNEQLDALVKQRTRTIQIQADELKELNQVKSRFFTNISHELRTPLTLILSPLEDLIGSTTSDIQNRQLRLMRTNAQRLLKLINQLLDLSKLDSDKLELQAAQMDFLAFVRQLTLSFQTLAQQRRLKLDFQTDLAECFVYFDEEKMEQVLMNLLSNALKFTPEGGQVQVQFLKVDIAGRPWASIVIKDNGIGISEEQLPYIFDRFYQADNADTRAFAGTGVGLSLTKELVELHNGQIQVNSKREEGTRFEIQLPLGREHLQDHQIRVLRPDRAAPAVEPEIEMAYVDVGTNDAVKPSGEQPLLLVADDHRELREYIARTLEQGFQVMQAKDGQDAWEMALKHTPDVIVSDVMMPRMSGYQLCDKLKSDMRTNHIPLILLTAKVGLEEKIKGLTHQADAYLTKPFNARELRLRTQNMLNLRNRLRKRFAGQVIFDVGEINAESQDEVFLQKISETVDAHLDDTNFGVDQLSSALGMSRSQLNRKMRALIDKSPNQYIRSFRLGRARQMIEKNTGTIAEIAYDTGFSSPAYFSKCFLDEFGTSPSEWKAKS